MKNLHRDDWDITLINNMGSAYRMVFVFLFLLISIWCGGNVAYAVDAQDAKLAQEVSQEVGSDDAGGIDIGSSSDREAFSPPVFSWQEGDLHKNHQAVQKQIRQNNRPSLADTIPSGADIAVIPVESEIYGFVKTSMERRVQRAIDANVSLIVFEFDTYGGELTSALEIAKFLKDPVKVPVQTIAWVNNKAYSAGILIASACDEIVMSRASSIGDCAPIVPGRDLSPTERAKALSPLLEEFRDNARENGLDYAPFHAMCVLGVEVYYIENPANGERHLVNQADYAWMVEGKDYDNSAYKDDPYAVGAVTYGIAPLNDPSQKGKWKPVSVLPSGARLPNGLVHAGNTLLTLNQTRAMDIGISKATIATVPELKQHYAANQITIVPQTWSEDIAGYLTNPLVRGILVMALLVGAYMEFQTPGIGIAGAVSVIALILLLGAPLIAGFAEVWHIAMFFIGFVLLVIELAFTPAFGLLGILGILMMLAGLVLAAVPSSGGPVFGPIQLPPSMQWYLILPTSLSMMLQPQLQISLNWIYGCPV